MQALHEKSFIEDWCLVHGVLKDWCLVHGVLKDWCLVHSVLKDWCLVHSVLKDWCLVHSVLKVNYPTAVLLKAKFIALLKRMNGIAGFSKMGQSPIL